MKRKQLVIGLVGLLITALTWEPAAAWSHANRYGGSTSHAQGSGSTTRTTASRKRDPHLRARHHGDRALRRHRDACRGVRLHDRHQ